MKKKKRSKRSTPYNASRRTYSSSVDGHPLFTALFIIFCIIIASFALFAIALHKVGEKLDERINVQVAQPTPMVTSSPVPLKRTY